MGEGKQRADGDADRAGGEMRRTIPYVDDFIHLNTAAGSLADQSVYDAIQAQLMLEARSGMTEARTAVAESR